MQEYRYPSTLDLLCIEYFIPNTGRLYHYTRQGSFSGILSNFTFWCTDARFCNDRSEIEHAYTLLRNILGEVEENFTSDELQSEVVRAIKKGINSFKSRSKYVLCFSEKPDDLNQYRAYASPGAGYCLGFDTDDLVKLANSYDGFIGCCLYGEREQKKVVSSSLKETLKELDQYFPVRGPGDINEDLVDSRAKSFLNFFSLYAPLFKNGAFKEEEEVRIIFDAPVGEEKIQFRCGEVTMVPYRSISLTFGDSSKVAPQIIYIKAAAEAELTRMGAEQFLLSQGVDPMILEQSRIPYRETV